MKLSKPPPIGIENYQYLKQIWKQKQMSSFKEFSKWQNNEDVVPFLQAMQKRLLFTTTTISIWWSLLVHYQTRLRNVCKNLQMQKPIPSQKGINIYWEKNRGDVVGSTSIIFARKVVVDETFIRKSTNKSKSIVEIDGNQLYPYSMCQPVLIPIHSPVSIRVGISFWKPLESHLNKTRPAALKIRSCLFFNEQDPIIK